MYTVGVAGALAVLLLASAFALGQERTSEWQWGMHPMMFMWGAGGLVMMLMMLVFWGLVIAGLALGVRWLAAGDPAPTLDRPSPGKFPGRIQGFTVLSRH